MFVCSGYTLFASILNSSVMLGNYLQQTTSADDIFRCIFFLDTLSVKFTRHSGCSWIATKIADQKKFKLSYVLVVLNVTVHQFDQFDHTCIVVLCIFTPSLMIA